MKVRSTGFKSVSMGVLAVVASAGLQTPWLGGVASAASAPYNLVLAYPDFGGSTNKDLSAVQAAMSQYLEKKIGATVTLEPMDSSNYTTKINLMLATRKKVDVMFTASWEGLADEVASHELTPLNSLLSQYGKGITKTLPSIFLSSGKINGYNYATPTNKEFSGYGGFVMNQDLVNQYHIDLAKVHTMSDMTAIFQTIKEKDPGITPLFASQAYAPSFAFPEDPLGDGFGVIDPFQHSLKVVDLYEMPEIVKDFNIFHQWFLDGYINKDAATTQVDGMAMINAHEAFATSQPLKPGKAGELQTSVPLTQVGVIKPFSASGIQDGAMMAIPVSAQNPVMSMKFMNLMYTDRYLINLFDYGIEGQDFVKLGPNTIGFPKGVNASSVGYAQAPWMWGNQMMTYLHSNEAKNKWAEFRHMDDVAVKSLALGFTFNPSKVLTEEAACTNVLNQYLPALDTGAVDPKVYLPKLVQALKAAGLDKIIADKQAQLYAWYKSTHKS